METEFVVANKVPLPIASEDVDQKWHFRKQTWQRPAVGWSQERPREQKIISEGTLAHPSTTILTKARITVMARECERTS